MSRSTCCCCIELRSGAIAIGVLFIIIHGLGVIGSIISVVEASQLPRWEPSRSSILGGSVTSLVAAIVWVVLDALLLRGITSQRPGMVMAWLCWSVFVVTLGLLGACGLFIFSIILGEGFLIGYSVGLFVGLLVNAYWTYVVSTYCRVMKREASSQGGRVIAPGQLAPGQSLVFTTTAAPVFGQHGTELQYRPGNGYGVEMQYRPPNGHGVEMQYRPPNGHGVDMQYRPPNGHGVDMQYRPPNEPKPDYETRQDQRSYQPSSGIHGSAHENRATSMQYWGSETPRGGGGGGGYPNQAWKGQHQPPSLPPVDYEDGREYSRGEYSSGGRY